MTDSIYQGINNRFILPNHTRARHLKIVIMLALGVVLIRLVVAAVLFMNQEELEHKVVLETYIMLGDTFIGLVPNSILPIFLMMWMARAYYNLHRAGLKDLHYRPGWSIGAWFVPLMNLFRPYYIVREIWYRKQTAFRQNQVAPEEHSTLRNWWLLSFAPILVLPFISYSLDHQSPYGPPRLYGCNIFIHLFQFASLFMLHRAVDFVSVQEEAFLQRFREFQLDQVARVAQEYQTEQQLTAGIATNEKQFATPEHSKIIEGEFVDTSGKNNFVQVGLWIITLCSFFFALHEIWLVTHSLSEPVPKFISAISGILAPIFLLALPVFGIGFLVWIHDSYKNLFQLKIEELAITRSFHSYWWLIPGLNFIVAFIMLRDIKKYTQIALTDQTEEPDPLPLLDWTWLSGVLAIMFIWIAGMVGRDGNSHDQMMYAILDGGGFILLFVALCCAILSIRKIKSWEKELFSRVEKAVSEELAIKPQ